MYTSFTEWDKGLYLAHHGIKGQKWGQRRFQNEDGSLTAAGVKRYQQDDNVRSPERDGYIYKSRAGRKYERKASEMAKKADHATDEGLSEKTQKEAWKYMNKAFKYEQRAVKADKRAEKKQSSMVKKVANAAISWKLAGRKKNINGGQKLIRYMLFHKVGKKIIG